MTRMDIGKRPKTASMKTEPLMKNDPITELQSFMDYLASVVKFGAEVTINVNDKVNRILGPGGCGDENSVAPIAPGDLAQIRDCVLTIERHFESINNDILRL